MTVAARDYYEELGVARDASTSEIRKAYRKLARTHHPDVSSDPGATARFAAIAEAYEVLRDKTRRAEYDRPPARAARPADGGFADGGFGDLFSQMFGDRMQRQGADQEAILDLTLEEAAPGGSRRFSLADGRDFDVKVPPGVRDGQRIRLAGEGQPGAGGGPPGDLFLRVRLLPHPRFRRDGLDLSVDVPITPWEAALGVSADVPTLVGHAKVRIPGGSSSGRRLRLRGHGMPGPGAAQGDIYAVVRIVLPKTLSDDERGLFEQLATVSGFHPREELT